MSQIKPLRGIQLNKTHPRAKGLVGYWVMNEGSGSRVKDLSGNGNTLLKGATCTWVGGPSGPAIYAPQDPTTQSILTNQIVLSKLGASIVFAYRKVNEDHFVVAGGNSSASYPRIIFISGGALYFQTNTDGDQAYATPVRDTLWHTYAITCRGSVVAMYQDGRALTMTDSSITDDLTIGRFFAAATSYQAKGTFDYFLIYNRALSASEVAQLYREPFAMFDRRQIWLSGEAGATVSLSGVTTATSSAVGTIISSETLVATVSATGGASSSAGCAMTLIGVATAQSTGSAALSSGESTTGLVAALSTASGTVVLSGSLAGSVTCVSTASGSLRCLYSLAGVIAVASGASGAVTTSTDTTSLAGVVACIAAADGAVKQAAELAGIVSAVCTPVALLSTSVGGAWYKIVAAGSAGIVTSQLANQATRILVSAYTAGAQGIKKTSSGLTTIQTCAILSVGGKINIFLTADFAYGTSYSVTFKVYCGASQLYQWIRAVNSSNGITIMKHFSDTPGAGTHTYTLQANASTPSDNQMLATACSLVLDEWKGK